MRLALLLLLAVSARGFLLHQGASTFGGLGVPAGIVKVDRGRQPVSPHHQFSLCPPLPAVPAGLEMTTSAPRRLVGKISPASTVFFACDIQERFRDLIYNMPAVISTARFLIDVSQVLEVKCVATEQYPKALLKTVPELNIGTDRDQIDVPIFEKTLFSMCTPKVMDHVEGLPNKPKNVVLFGIEAHVCVTQTCLDLLESGYEVHIVCDGVSSQKPHDRTVALQRMQQVGAYLTTAEQVAFQLLKSADDDELFKSISTLVKRRNTEGINTFSTSATL